MRSNVTQAVTTQRLERHVGLSSGESVGVISAEAKPGSGKLRAMLFFRNSPRKIRNALFHALRFAFRLVPMREGSRDRLRQWFLQRFSAIRPSAAQGRLPAAGHVRRARIAAG
ncbi:MAG TPA: hypothetical protein VFS82_01055, partial [Lysobacter sp.]|nr:hypothetical protein [Lysobacter sp.]